MPDIGRLESVPLNAVWPNEEYDFTPWLAKQDNLEILGDALGMSLEFVGREESVGPYSADILCRVPNDQTKVVVENQLGPTDHDHLGKLLTYAAHFKAGVIIWIAKTFTEQHRVALDWLNETSGGDTRFFGVEIELLRVGDSLPAAKFAVVARPSDWTDSKDKKALTKWRQAQLSFWKGFAEFVSRNGTVITKTHSPRPDSWLGVAGVGKGGFFLHGVMTYTDGVQLALKAELQITGEHSEHYFRLLVDDRGRVEEDHEFEDELVWYRADGVAMKRIYWITEMDLMDVDQRTERYRWLLERLEALHSILAPKIQKLPVPG